VSVDISKIKTLALAATQPGPWTVEKQAQGKGRHSYVVLDANGMRVADCDEAPDDAAFIAAASPDVVLELIERLLTAEAYRLNRTTDQWVLDAKVKALTSALDESRASDKANAEASIDRVSKLYHMR